MHAYTHTLTCVCVTDAGSAWPTSTSTRLQPGQGLTTLMPTRGRPRASTAQPTTTPIVHTQGAGRPAIRATANSLITRAPQHVPCPAHTNIRLLSVTLVGQTPTTRVGLLCGLRPAAALRPPWPRPTRRTWSMRSANDHSCMHGARCDVDAARDSEQAHSKAFFVLLTIQVTLPGWDGEWTTPFLG